jgi:hypothetical protein
MPQCRHFLCYMCARAALYGEAWAPAVPCLTADWVALDTLNKYHRCPVPICPWFRYLGAPGRPRLPRKGGGAPAAPPPPLPPLPPPYLPPQPPRDPPSLSL